MLAKIKLFFDSRLTPEPDEDPEQALQLAACALLFEMVKADFEISASELQAMRKAVQTVMNIDDGTADTLIQLAQEESEAATSLYQFTRLINDNYSLEQKRELVKALWMIAFADGHVDRYEEHYLRKLVDLLYVPHSLFIQTKLEVQENRGKGK
jgi:uncharacterized tellurite resistance protein B-like protein